MAGMTEAVYVSQGKKRLVGALLIDQLGNDISGYTYTVAVGASDVIPPTSGWAPADLSQQGVNNQQRIVKKMIDAAVPIVLDKVVTK
jgi:hypothetical protein